MLGVIIPAQRMESLFSLLNRLERALDEINYAVVIVDNEPLKIMVDRVKKNFIHLPSRSRGRSRAAALADGIKYCVDALNADIIAVINAEDDVEKIPLMLSRIEEGYDLVVGAYVFMKNERRFSQKIRALIGESINLLMKMLLPRARHLSIMYGEIFAMRTEVIKGVEMKPRGSSILPGIIEHGNWNKVTVLPHIIGYDTEGKSKIDFRATLGFLFSLLVVSPLIPILIAGISGTIVNLFTLWLLLHFIPFIEYYISSAIAIEISVVNNFIISDFFLRGKRKVPKMMGLFMYHGIAAISIITQYGTANILHYLLHINPISSQFIGILLGFLTTYLLSTEKIWK